MASLIVTMETMALRFDPARFHSLICYSPMIDKNTKEKFLWLISQKNRRVFPSTGFYTTNIFRYLFKGLVDFHVQEKYDLIRTLKRKILWIVSQKLIRRVFPQTEFYTTNFFQSHLQRTRLFQGLTRAHPLTNFSEKFAVSLLRG